LTDFVVIYEQAHDGGWWAHAVDLPVFAAGDSREDAEREVREAIAFYLDTLRDAGEGPPATRGSVGTVSV
jgi:predicted RNase H-like HicB family nuclease